MNDSNKEHFEAFPEDGFKIFINCLETQGYVIDCKDEQDFVFSSTQLDNMTEEVFDALINKFNINTELNFREDILSIGDFHEEHGGYSMIYNSKIITYNQARKILKRYLESL